MTLPAVYIIVQHNITLQPRREKPFALWCNAEQCDAEQYNAEQCSAVEPSSCLAAFADRVIWAAQEQLVPKAQGRMCKKRQKSQVLEYEIFGLTIFTKLNSYNRLTSLKWSNICIAFTIFN